MSSKSGALPLEEIEEMKDSDLPRVYDNPDIIPLNINQQDDIDIVCLSSEEIEDNISIELKESINIGNNRENAIINKSPRNRTERRTEKRMIKKRRKQLLRNLQESQHDLGDLLEGPEEGFSNTSFQTNEDNTRIHKSNTGEMLNNLINDLTNKIRTKHPYISNIKRPQLLLQSLRELNDMVGMDRLKEGVTLQVLRLIEAVNGEESDLGMLNTILYGDPGVGKTRIGIILAKIWYSIGFLENNVQNDVDKTVQIEVILQNPMFIFLIGMVITYGWAMVSKIYNKYGIKGLIISFIAIGIILGIVWYYYMKSQGDIEDKNTDVETDISHRDDSFDRSIIKVASGEDFIAGFVGQSAIKTKALLQSCLGKVLFIDEAYSLYEPPYGSVFGAEALAAITLFMSENSGKIVVVFAGYKDKMKQGIFKVQPGLPRRCMWHFECDSYDGKQLSEIFLRQLQSKGWSVDNPRNIRQIISDQANLFPSYGGDTERLIFYSQLAASKNHFYNGNNKNKNVLTVRDITDGLQYLAENNIHDNTIDKNVGMDSSSQNNDISNDRLKSLLHRIDELS